MAVEWRGIVASTARGQGSRSAGHTYQEALKLLGFSDVDPVVLLHHLDVLHLVIEPGRTHGHSPVVTAHAHSPRLTPDLLGGGGA